MNETLKTIASRFSCRNFNEKMPDDESLNAIAQAAIQAPSGMNRQNWQVIVIKNKDVITEMEAEGLQVLAQMEDKTMYQRIMARGGKLFYNAPCMILIAVKESYPKGAEWIDCGILAQNIALSATSLGLANLHCGFAQMAFAGSGADELKKKLQIPEGHICGLSVLFGYTDTPGKPHTPNQEKITIIA